MHGRLGAQLPEWDHRPIARAWRRSLRIECTAACRIACVRRLFAPFARYERRAGGSPLISSAAGPFDERRPCTNMLIAQEVPRPLLLPLRGALPVHALRHGQAGSWRPMKTPTLGRHASGRRNLCGLGGDDTLRMSRAIAGKQGLGLRNDASADRGRRFKRIGLNISAIRCSVLVRLPGHPNHHASRSMAKSTARWFTSVTRSRPSLHLMLVPPKACGYRRRLSCRPRRPVWPLSPAGLAGTKVESAL